MSVVIIGGHDRMVCQYKEICKIINVKQKYLPIYLVILNQKLVTLIYWYFLQVRFLIVWYMVLYKRQSKITLQWHVLIAAVLVH